MHSFLLIGQSNMAGRGFINEAHEIDASRIYTLRNGRWHKMFRPINPDRSFSGVNLAESFAEAYSKKYSVDVGLICCADGGTKLAQWMPGELLYDHAIAQAKLAQRTSEIVGVLWHQGESDSYKEFYPTYQERLEVMLGALRKELDLQNVPIILGGLGDFLEFYPLEHHIHINQALKNAAQKDALIGFASAEGLQDNGDHLHFNADALYQLGLRYFDEFEKLHDSHRDLGQKKITEDVQRSAMELL